MKKILSALLLCFGICIALSAQDSLLNRSKLPKTLYFYDDFIDNRNKWPLYDNIHSLMTIKDGSFLFENRCETGYWHYQNFNVNPTSTAFYEIEFTVAEAISFLGNGLIFNYESTCKNNSWEFLITPKGEFRISKRENGESTEMVSWSYSAAIHLTGSNKLGLLYKGKNLYYYINGVLVHTSKRPAYLGNSMGVSAATGSKLLIDKWTIRYNPPTTTDVEDNRESYKKESLGPNINSNQDDVFPILSADGTLMFFSRSINRGAEGVETCTIMYSTKNEADEWAPAKPAGKNLNYARLPRVVYVSPDKNTLLISILYDKNKPNAANEGLFISQRTATGFSNPEKINIPGYTNLDYYTFYTMSGNGKALILSLNTKNNYGQKDLYVSLKQPNGKWGAVKNMGAVLNSFGDEGNPCLAPDNVTLYFDSDGKPGYGQSDMFVARRLDDTWLHWSEPQNLGPHINNSFNNFGLQVDAHGDYAYINEIASGSSKNEIKRFLLPEAARPNPVVIVTGHVYNMLTKEPMAMPVIYENLESGYEEGTANSSPNDGTFVVVLPYGVNYGLTAKKQGYMCESKRVDLKADSLNKGFAEVSVDLYVMPLTVGQSITLNNIFFGPDKYELEENSFAELDRLRSIMSENPTLQIEINGHTDRGGENATDEQLTGLSQNRANSVRDYLSNKGITTERITAIGFGRQKPVSDNQKLNRRVEIKIIAL